MKDIAKKAQVSVNTVSRALNDKPDISEPTKEKIQEIAKQLNYKRNILARNLRTTKTKTIGVVISDNSNPFFAKVLKGIQDATNGHGYQIILCNTEEKYEKEEEAIQLLIELRVAGLLITPTQTRIDNLLELKQLGVPFVLLARKMENIMTNYVVCDDVEGAYIATSYIIQQGHRKIAFLGGLSFLSDAKGRLKGYKQALSEKQLEFNPSLVRVGYFNPETGYEAMKQILMEQERPTAVFCFSDYVAMGAIKAIQEKQLEIPYDIAVVGYDDIEFATYLKIPLTTIKNPQYSMGVEATGLLLSIIEGKITQPQQVILKPELKIRESC
jgi:LacI family transcriptional regulator